MSIVSANSATAGATKAYGASRGAVRVRCCFTSAGLNREAALLHVVQDDRLYLGERAEERSLARNGAAERGLEFAVGHVHVRAPGDRGGLGRVLLGERPE